MKKINFQAIAKNVVETEIKSLKRLKTNINKSFNKAVEAILNCRNGKVIVSGVGKSGIIGKKISSTLSSVGTPSFFVDANECSHGNLGQIAKNDVLILISFSGKSSELKNIIQYSKLKKITLIGIVSKKNSLLYKNSDIKLLIPEVTEADPNGIVPTSSSIVQLSLGHCLCVATMKYKKFGKLDFKKFHPSGSLGAKLKTVEDLMTKNIPFINENTKIKKALKTMSQKKLGILIAKNSKGFTTGIITDGQLRRATQKLSDISNYVVKKIMTKNPITVHKDMLAAQGLSIMTNNKITSLCVHKGKKKYRTIGILHIHNILTENT